MPFQAESRELIFLIVSDGKRLYGTPRRLLQENGFPDSTIRNFVG